MAAVPLQADRWRCTSLPTFHRREHNPSQDLLPAKGAGIALAAHAGKQGKNRLGGSRPCSSFLSGMKVKKHGFPCVQVTMGWTNLNTRMSVISHTMNFLRVVEVDPGILWLCLSNVYCSFLLQILKMVNNCSSEYILPEITFWLTKCQSVGK